MRMRREEKNEMGKRRIRRKRRMRNVAQRIRSRKNKIMRGIRVYRIGSIG